jgi:hypothetical protein
MPIFQLANIRIISNTSNILCRLAPYFAAWACGENFVWVELPWRCGRNGFLILKFSGLGAGLTK